MAAEMRLTMAILNYLLRLGDRSADLDRDPEGDLDAALPGCDLQ